MINLRHRQARRGGEEVRLVEGPPEEAPLVPPVLPDDLHQLLLLILL